MLKVCTTCKQTKALEDFPKRKNRGNKLDSRCRSCISFKQTVLVRQRALEAGKAQKQKTLEARALGLQGLKRCCLCKQEKLFAEFSKAKHQSYGVNSRCRECCARTRPAYNPENYNKRKAQQKAANLKRKFGITLEAYEAMFTSQSGNCGICGQPDTKALAVDHDHTTGKVRELLCGRCNPGIGFMRTPELGERMVAYLRKHQEQG